MLKKKAIHFDMLPMHTLGWLRFGGNQKIKSGGHFVQNARRFLYSYSASVTQ
jgi:hypothetical protein